MLLVFALLFSYGLVSARAGDQPTSPDFSRYPQTEAFRFFVKQQTNATRHLQHVFAMTELTNTASVAVMYHVTDRGEQTFDTDRWPIPGIRVGSGWLPPRLSDTELRTLISAIRELPPTNALPPIDELVIVSFHQGTNWITRSFDKRSLPKPMADIYEIKRPKWVRSFTVQ